MPLVTTFPTRRRSFTGREGSPNFSPLEQAKFYPLTAFLAIDDLDQNNLDLKQERGDTEAHKILSSDKDQQPQRDF
ncbi:hypothetical protein KSZ_46930 [Dictyobacter formicarum]|uniref:Uncharacterized protein n=1 Tax=Dictyobacter formicarum TaxID=2778368 RepID=A0ABQ3VKG2_9CHLR|nr:hypothetical protein KSZ_46930 [Dictyobacter formicarum]